MSKENTLAWGKIPTKPFQMFVENLQINANYLFYIRTVIAENNFTPVLICIGLHRKNTYRNSKDVFVEMNKMKIHFIDVD